MFTVGCSYIDIGALTHPVSIFLCPFEVGGHTGALRTARSVKLLLPHAETLLFALCAGKSSGCSRPLLPHRWVPASVCHWEQAHARSHQVFFLSLSSRSLMGDSLVCSILFFLTACATSNDFVACQTKWIIYIIALFVSFFLSWRFAADRLLRPADRHPPE